MKIVLETNHKDNSGGGKYSVQLAKILSSLDSVEVFIKNRLANDRNLSGIDFQVKDYDNSFVPDLFIEINHHPGHFELIGKVNAKVCFYPLEQHNYSLYDFVICLNNFSEKQFRQKYSNPSIVINPYIDTKQYHICKKENYILNVGNYFFDEDGNSKNQHLVIDWFLKNKLNLQYQLFCVGFICNNNYYNSLKNFVKDRIDINNNSLVIQKSNVNILDNISFEQLNDLYAKSKFMVHAMGYKRQEYATEHFGYVFLEAMASGCQPITHNSGGGKDIEGVKVWNELDNIDLESYSELELRTFSSVYSFENSKNQAGKVFELIKTQEKKKLNLGCGLNYRNGWVNIDKGSCKKDIDYDLEKLPLPFLDNEFDELALIHVLEHIDKKIFLSFMRELNRISKHNAIIHIEVPYFRSKNAFTDFTHVNFFTEDSFGYFDNNHYLRETGKIYGIDFVFEVHNKIIENPEKTLIFDLIVKK